MVNGILALPFFNDLDISDSAINAFSTVISYINAFDDIFNVRLMFTLLFTFFGLMLIGLLCSIVFKFLHK